MKSLCTLVGGSLLAGLLHAQPALPTPPFPQFDNAAALATACDQGLAQARAGLKALEARPPDAGWLRAYDDASAKVEDLAYPLGFLAHVHPDKAIRAAAEACELKWQGFSSSAGQSQPLYRALRNLPPGDAVDEQLRRTAQEGLEDAGAGLPPAQRRVAKRLLDQLAALGQRFERNLRDQNLRVAYTETELAGVPPAVWKDARRDAQGRVLLGVDYPSYNPVVQGAHSPAARERAWRAKVSEGGPPNLKLLAHITRLRKQYAAVFGLPSYAAFNLRRNMAATPQQAESFLAEVKAAVASGEQQDLAQLRQAKAAHLGLPLAQVVLQRWDLPYYQEKLRRERHAVDQEAFRPYFPPQQSLEFVMRLVEQLMGVRYTRVPDAKLWHPEAQAWAVSDAASGQPLATLYVDLYPREGKYNHAAVWPLRSGAIGHAQAGPRAPVAALVVNFDRNGLSLEELETLLHEFGHAVHTNLSATRYVSQAGTSVKRDFVEAPSQMLEEWVYDQRVLAGFAQVCPACKPVPADLVAKAVAARDFGKGLLYARQHLYASYDLALYGPRPGDPLALWRRMEAATPMGHVPGTLFPAGFGHVATHYGANYYGYLWSLVLAFDMRTAFGSNLLDTAVGQRYRSVVLANGGQKPPQALLREFLGREPQPAAFFNYLKR